MADTSSPALSANTIEMWRGIVGSAPRPAHMQAILRRRPGLDVAERISKKQLILGYRESHALTQAGERELRLIQRELRDRLGGDAAPSLSYITNVLREAGTQVEYEDRYTDPAVPSCYSSRLEGVLRLHDLATAEDALIKLDAAYHDYHAVLDHAGARLVRKLVLRGKQRAEMLARNGRVNAEKRLEKREIATWFRIWLESPDLFFGWLEVRKQTEEFRTLFGSCPSGPPGEAPVRVPES
jgi:hypothetical protein